MQQTVTNTNERKSLFSSYLEILDAKEKQAKVDRQLQEEKHLRRTQRIYDLHDRQRREAVELRRCLEFVSQHAHVLETALRGAEGGAAVPLSAALVRPAAALQRCMAQCVSNAAAIRHLVGAAHQPQMDAMLAKMEAELSTWTSFLQRAVDATYNSEMLIDNVHNMIAEQRRYVREVSASNMFASLCADADAEAGASGAAEAQAEATQPRPISCSTPNND